MKPLLFVLLLISQISSLKAQSFQFDSVSFKNTEIGKVLKKGDSWIIRVNEGEHAKDYWPVNLTEKYEVEGQAVAFEGAVGRIPANVRLVGTPIRLTNIRTLSKAKVNEPGKEMEVSENKLNKNAGFDSLDFVKNGIGTVILISDTYLIEQLQNGETKRYYPDYLPEDFRQENLRITFSGVVGKPDPNVRMLGTPLKIKELTMTEEVHFDDKQIQAALMPFYPFDSVGYLPPSKGTIMLISDSYVIEVENGRNSTTRYLPAVLPHEFKVEGLAVIVSGTIGKIPPNVRLVGTPLKINEIKIAER